VTGRQAHMSAACDIACRDPAYAGPRPGEFRTSVNARLRGTVE
jgi:hypothetical protein